MKKILAIALAVVFMFALAIPAFAVDYTREEEAAWDSELATGNVTPSTDIIYNVGGSYIVTVPAGFTVDSDSVSNQFVSASNVLIPKGKVLTVSLDSTNNYKLKYVADASADEIAYTVTKKQTGVDDTAVAAADGSIVLTVNAGGVATAADGASAGTTELVFDFADRVNARYQGQYKDTITFTVAIATYTPPQQNG